MRYERRPGAGQTAGQTSEVNISEKRAFFDVPGLLAYLAGASFPYNAEVIILSFE